MNDRTRYLLNFEFLMLLLFVSLVVADDLLVDGPGEYMMQAVILVIIGGLLAAKWASIRRMRRALHAEADKALEVDALTGLYNHRKCNELLKELIQQGEASQQPLSVLYFDVDDFTPINDNYGFEVGDQVLKHVVHYLLAHRREGDVVGRYAGDEFIMILPSTDAEQADVLATKLQARLNIEPFRFNQYEEALPISVSIGVANYPNDGTNVTTLLENALTSTEQAKREGKAKIHRVPTYTRIEQYVEDSSHDLEMYILSLKDKDTYTVQHSEDVARYALILADALSLPATMKKELRTAGIFHDIGKILIPDRILKKPGRLSDDEYELMKKHVIMSHEILDGHYTSETMKQAVICHHERFDGRGYPLGLSGMEIPLVGRIMAIADAFSAMTLDRAYRKSKNVEEALAELQRCASSQFDPELVAIFCSEIENHRDLLLRTLDYTYTTV